MNDGMAQRRADFARAAEAFAALRGLTAASRQERLKELERSDPALGAEVRSLLRYEAEGALFLDSPVVMAPEGMQVGRYRILSMIGEGGMGAVFLAEQSEPVHRQVALKLIKLGMDTRAVVRRFEGERQVLARMEHPGIARILDGGVAPDGRPYFAMELVRGQPLTEWCGAHGVDTATRIGLFLQVCSAVQHAHQKGVIHRDLKPSNLLVTEVDGKPVVKVIDFGIAKVLDDDQFHTRGTATGPTAGTLEYMSPEQLDAASSNDLDIRSDVYSLGVVLHELLTDTHPAQARTRTGVLRRPAVIRPRLRGDLDAIVMKALEHDPARRYPTVAALADDLERHLRHEPVLARPASALYLATQFARRHSLALGAALVTVLALLSGLALAVWGLHRAREDIFASTIERGRLAGVVGDLVEARTALWNCYLERPDSPHAAWALRELYFRHPCTWTMDRRHMTSAYVEGRGDGALVVAGSKEPPCVVDTETGRVLLECQPASDAPAQDEAMGLGVSPDGTLAAVADGQGNVRVWSLVTGACAGLVASHGKGYSTTVFLPDGQELLTAGADGRFLRVPVGEPEHARLIWQAADGVRVLAAHPATGMVAAGLRDGTVLLWRSLDAPPQHLVLHQNIVMSLAFSADGTRLASGSTDRSAAVWTTESGQVLMHLPSDNGTVRDVRFAADGTLYMLGWWKLGRLAPGATRVETVLAEGGWRMALPDARHIVTTSGQYGEVRGWYVDPAAVFEPLNAEGHWTLMGVARDPACALLAKDTRLMARDVAGTRVWEHQFAAAPVAAATSRAGDCIVVGLADGTLWVNSGAAPEWHCIARDYVPGSRGTIAVDGAGERAAYRAAGDAVALAWVREPTRAPVHVLAPSSDEQLAIAFDWQGDRVVATQRGQSVRVVDLAIGHTRQHACGQTMFAVAAAPDGTMIMGGWTGPLHVLHPVRGVQRVWRGHVAIAGTVAAHPTEPDLVLSGSMDGTVRLWHRGLGREVQSLSPFGGAAIKLVAFDPTGQRVMVAAGDGRAVTWPLYRADEFIRGNSPMPPAASRDLPR